MESVENVERIVRFGKGGSTPAYTGLLEATRYFPCHRLHSGNHGGEELLG